MPQLEMRFIMVTCDGPGCDKSVTYPATQQDKDKAEQENPWLINLRLSSTSQGPFAYCSDVCEVNSITAGKHNRPEEKKVIDIQAGAAGLALRQAARMAEEKAKADKAIKEGTGITIQS